MFKSLALTVGLRYTRAKRRNGFISFISLISMIGMVLGVAVLIIVLSVMNGFDRELRQRILGMVPHAKIETLAPLDDWQALAARAITHEGVVGVAPFVYGQGMFTHLGRVQAVAFQGILPEQEANVSILPDYIVEGRLDSLQAGEYNVIMGDILARNMGLVVGDKVTLVMPEASLSVAGVIPRLKRFTLTGIFKVGAELDANLAVMHLQDAKKLKRLSGEAEGLRIKTANLFNAANIVKEVAMSMDEDVWTSNWTRTHGNLFQAIQMERQILALLLMLIIAVATFNIVSTQVMLVVDKQSDIAILRTLGATPRTIMGIFIVQGLTIGLIGIITGSALGLLVAYNITDMVAWLEQLFNFQVLNADVYFISYFPSQVRLDDVAIICIVASILSLVATLYPAWKASKIEPAEALRYE